MKFYSVITAFYDNGKVTAFLGDSVEADKIPENTSEFLRDRDLYTDWFTTRKEALAFKADALMA